VHTARSALIAQLPRCGIFSLPPAAFRRPQERAVTRSACRPFAKDLVDNGYEEAKRLARASASSHDIAATRGASLDRLDLVHVKFEGRSGVPAQ
jgi:hypothetical protein